MSRVQLIEAGGVKVDVLGGTSFIEPGANQTTHTFSSVALGPASSSGLLVIGVGVVGSLSNPTACLVNGNAASLVSGANVSGSGRGLSIYQITGESGTGTVEVQSANPANRWLIGLYKLRAVQNTTRNDVDDDTAGSLSFDVPRLGVGIGFTLGDGSPSSPTFSGLNKDFETSVGVGAGQSLLAGAHAVFTTAQSPLAVTITMSASAKRDLGASWR